MTDEFSPRGLSELARPQPPMFYFRDPDGNALLIVSPAERGAR
jgi:hypothetical protein